MKIVSDSSPICYLRMIDQIHLLPALFGEVVVPEAVVRELSDEGAPQIVREWIEQPPAWLKMQKAAPHFDPLLESLHVGEREVIALAFQIKADLVLIDEKAARRIAKERDFNVTGLIGVLDEAGSRGMVDLIAAVRRLSQTSFRVSPQLLKMLVDKRRFH